MDSREWWAFTHMMAAAQGLVEWDLLYNSQLTSMVGKKILGLPYICSLTLIPNGILPSCNVSNTHTHTQKREV